VRVVFGQNCFHHFPHPDRFFGELERVLQPGGGVILLEPYFGPFASLLFKRLFTSEGYDKKFPSWETPVAGPMNGANQALSYIVFNRDRREFERRFPSLKIVHEEPCRNYLKYLLSGGLNFRQLVPYWASPLIRALQWALSPLDRWLALHHVVVLRKEGV
jgi:SAM-dependent methyltransferase